MIPIYRTDPYLFSLETIADAVAEEGDHHLVTCRELIFAEGGGQPADQGSITFGGITQPVLELIKNKGDMRLRISKIPGLVRGEKVIAEIDGQRRKSIMRLHTTQHAMAGALRRVLSDYETGGMQISEDAKECTMRFISKSFNGQSHLAHGISIVEQGVKDNLQVKAEVFDSLESVVKQFGELFRPSDARVQIKGKVRVITIDGLDVNACGGTHLRSLGEAQVINVSIKEYNPESGEGLVTIT